MSEAWEFLCLTAAQSAVQRAGHQVREALGCWGTSSAPVLDDRIADARASLQAADAMLRKVMSEEAP